MTTEPPGAPEPIPVPEPTPAAVPPAPAPAAASMSTMSGENMVMIGAALVLVSYVIFSLIANEYHQYIVQLVAAVFAVLLPTVNKEAVGRVAPVPVLMKVLGYTIAIGGLFELLYDVRFGVLDEFMDIAGAITAYAGYVLAFIGARAIKT